MQMLINFGIHRISFLIHFFDVNYLPIYRFGQLDNYYIINSNYKIS